MQPAYPQLPGFPLPFRPKRPVTELAAPPVAEAAPDHHTQLEELIGHVRRCEKWARIDDRIDLSLRLQGEL